MAMKKSFKYINNKHAKKKGICMLKKILLPALFIAAVAVFIKNRNKNQSQSKETETENIKFSDRYICIEEIPQNSGEETFLGKCDICKN